MKSTERVVISRSDRSCRLARGSLGVRSARRSNVRLDGTVFVHVCRAQVGIRVVSELCHMPPKPWGNTVTYGDTSTHIDLAEIVESEVRWWDLVCVSTREEIQFPSVLDRPLRHLSV
jgi:hypothetical protein